MNDISIKITGGPAMGKSAIAELIRQTLEAKGITVVLSDDNGLGIVDEHPGVIAASLDMRLGSIAARGRKVLVSTVNQRRHATQ